MTAISSTMNQDTAALVSLLVSILEKAEPEVAPRLLPALARLPGPVGTKYLQLVTEEEHQRDKSLPTLDQARVDAFLQLLRGTILVMAKLSFVGFQGPVERRLLKAHYAARQSSGQSAAGDSPHPSVARSDAAWADIMADAALANIREDPYNSPALGFLPELLDAAGRFRDLLLQLKQWEYIHLAMKGTMYAVVKDGFRRALRWLRSSPPADGELKVEEEIRDLETRESFVFNNKRALAGTESYRPAVSRFTALQNVKEIKPVLFGFNDEGLRLPSRVVRIFTSSTFDDLRHERDALMARAYPEIRRRLKQLGLEFQVR